MKFDVFFSICQTPVDGYMPNEKVMWENFFDQVRWADTLGFDTAWVAETHLSSQVQKENPNPVIPHFDGEIGLNTDILQLAHVIFRQTKNINVGSAIRNILANGGPIAHAEAIRMFMSLHMLNPNEKRLLYLGFASGRFPYSNTPYGIRPRNEVEELAWPLVKGRMFRQATEIFLRFLRGDVFASSDITPQYLSRADFAREEDWLQIVRNYRELHPTSSLGGDSSILEYLEVKEGAGSSDESEPIEVHIPIPPVWDFDRVGVIPFEAPLQNLRLVIGAHDAETQNFANQFLPVGVFNLSFTPAHVVEETHQRMHKHFHRSGGLWKRDHMPRTVLVFIDDSPGLSDSQKAMRARKQGESAMINYWKAMEGTIQPERIAKAVDNALVGTPQMIADQLKQRFHAEDRLMLWFDFNNHDNEAVKRSMELFRKQVMPLLGVPETT